MNIKRKRNTNIFAKSLPITGLLCIAIIIGIKTQPVLMNGFNLAMEKVAVASAITALPDPGTKAIIERFHDELEPAPSEETSYEKLEPVQEEKPKKENTNSKEKPKDKPKQSTTAPTIPAQYRGSVEEQFFGVAKNASYIKYKNGYIRNSTKLDNAEIEKILETPWEKPTYKKGDEQKPLVLIYHTHATESFEKYDSDTYDTRNTWRSTDNSENITVVGDKICEILQEKGIPVVHDKTQHDYPSYNGSYDKSADTLQKYLDKYPSIKIALDIHRDAIQHDDVLIKPIYNEGEEKAAQVMIIAGCDDGTMNMPNWRDNLRFGAALQNAMTNKYDGIARPLFFAYRKYNQDMCKGGLLIEVGSHGNTLEEVTNAGELVANSLVDLLEN